MLLNNFTSGIKLSLKTKTSVYQAVMLLNLLSESNPYWNSINYVFLKSYFVQYVATFGMIKSQM